ncbi:hypothetical protein SAMN05444159_2290 [Bradyrhizobium lablabi]|uniref:Glycosaminoglycan attachment protein n=1 Tax=Bradyrhizobium lablabi TaxID=722472 RepID=A0A1M6PBY5_9BRAD|nr:hypothetical protein [Bradyrhizobium lablabi]SHK05390.1 hypothetical protein SAMN05444159_2290 [Bradyrhizobium lablabi]
MGEASRKAKIRVKREGLSRPLTAARFDIYAMGTRLSFSRMISEELTYWSDADERLLGMVFRDLVDDDYGWILLARDRIGRFRCIDVQASLRNESYATRGIRERIATALEDPNLAELGFQADEPNEPFDLLYVPSTVDRTKLHPYFKILLEESGRAPARAVLREIGPWLAPSDPHFVSEFQFKQFDQRLWELYLWATFRELGFDIKQPEAPDFLCRAPGMEFTVEATTVGPSKDGPLAAHPDPKTPDEMREFLAHYMPMKFGSSLTSKLNKKNKDGESYWERGDTANKPFILAIADFHIPGSKEEVGSMTYTHSALWPYLYGHRVDWERVEGKLIIKAVKNPDHHYRGKVIPTGFFDLPGSENVSAVLFSNAGTLAKFDRMGVAAGFAPPDHSYFRIGISYDSDPNAVVPKVFSLEVNDTEYKENWSDELQIFHNPNAKHPFAPDAFGGITQHFFTNGEPYSIVPENGIIASWTTIFRLVGDKANEQKETLV